MKTWLKRTVSSILSGMIVYSLVIPPIAFANVQTPLSRFDGNPDQWNNISYDHASGVSNFGLLKAFQTETHLFLYAEGSSIGDDYTFYLNTDENNLTGTPIPLWEAAIGVDYKVEANKLYKFQQDHWEEKSDLVVYKTSTYIETIVNLSDLELSGDASLRVGFSSDNDFLPKGSELALINASMIRNVPQTNITIDGIDTDWTNIKPLGISDTFNTTIFAEISVSNQLNLLISQSIMGNEYSPSINEQTNNEEPTIEVTISEEPISEEPISGETTSEEPISEEPTSEEPTSEETTSEEPISEEPTSEEPTSEETTSEEPISEEPISVSISIGEIYIDTDNQSQTGLSGQWPYFGADLKITDNMVFEWHNTEWIESDISLESATNINGEISNTELSLSLAEIAANSDSVRIAYKNGSENLPSMLNTPFKVLSESPTIQVDGSFSDWSGVPSSFSGNSFIESVYTFRDESRLYFYLVGSRFDKEMNIFIDSDNDPKTGHQGHQYSETGADYLIQNGLLFKSIGSDWAWEEIGNISRVITNQDNKNIAEYMINFSDWENVSDSMNFAIEVNNEYAPVKRVAKRYLPVPYPMNFPSIILDGNNDDWQSVTSITETSGSYSELLAVKDQDKLYTLVRGDSISADNIYYLDSDANEATGLKSSEWLNAGIDYKIEFNKLYKYLETEQTWKEVGPVGMDIYPNSIQMVAYLDDIGAIDSEVVNIAYVGNGSSLLPNKGEPLFSVTTTIENLQDANAYYPKESFESFINPFIGWSPWSTDDKYTQNLSMVYSGITWKDIEPIKGVYNWSGVEAKFKFDYWANKGVKINIRIILDDPGIEQKMDIPDWLYQEMVQEGGEAQAGRWYSTSSRSGFSPNYSNPLIIQYHEKLIKALAERYNDDERIGFIQIGSLGLWGEFHNYPEDVMGKFPDVEISDQYVNHYLTYFTNKKLAMRKPFPIAAANGIGLFNDSFGNPAASHTWLGWIDNGWDGIVEYVGSGDPQQAILDSVMPDFWKTSYSAGEFYQGNSLAYLTNNTIVETLQQVRDSHTSWLGPASPLKQNNLSPEIKANIELLTKNLGYRFVLHSIIHQKEADAGEEIDIETEWINKGVAPLYEDWPVAFALVDKYGNLLDSSITIATNTHTSMWMPGDIKESFQLNIPEQIAVGEYQLVVAILDPATNKPGVKLAIHEELENGWHLLDELYVNSSIDAPPTKPSSLTTYSQTPSTVLLSWNRSYDEEEELINYEVYVDDQLYATTAETTYLFSNLEPSTMYSFKVIALDGQGNRSEESTISYYTDGENKLNNPGFEVYTRTNGVADEWSSSTSSGVVANFQVVEEPVVSGGKAQQIGASNLLNGERVKINQRLVIEAGKPYFMIANVNIPFLKDAKLQFYLDFEDAEGNWLSAKSIEVNTTTSGYELLRASGTVPIGAVAATLNLSLRGTAGGGWGTVFVDDVEFYYGEEDFEVPTKPLNLRKVGTVENGAVVSWTASTDNVGVTGYEVYLNGLLKGTVTETTYTVTGLPEGQMSLITVKALDAAGNRSEGAELSVAAHGVNLLNNAGFEFYTRTNGVADEWSSSTSSGVVANFQVVEEPVVSGGKAQQIGASNLLNGERVKINQRLVVEAGQPYAMIANVNIPSLKDAKLQFYLDFEDAAGNWLAAKSVELNTTTSGYELLRASGTVPTGAVAATLNVSLRGTAAGGSGTLIIDDVEFYYGEEDFEVPTKPLNLRKVGTVENGAVLSWTASTDNVGITGYEVYLNGLLKGTVTQTTYTVTGLPEGQIIWKYRL